MQAQSWTPPRVAAEHYGAVVSAPAVPSECQGFALEGLRYSPGGSVLPNRCRPFDPTANNPYAVRCVDAWSHYDTGFPGDEYCILPPPPDKGLQLGAHPQGLGWFEQVAAGDLSGYAAPRDAWVMEPGEEETRDFTTSAANRETRRYYRGYHRTRTGLHHGVISAHDDPEAKREVWSDATLVPAGGNPFKGAVTSGIAGLLRADENGPRSLEKPPEDDGLYYELAANPTIIFDLHTINFTAAPLLKEAWTNLWWEEDARTPIVGFYGFEPAQALLTITAGETLDLHYFWRMTERVRVINLFGHRHAWSPIFSAWIERKGQAEAELLYRSFDWLDVPTYSYDSLTTNPAANGPARTDGGASGLVELEVGDELHFNCHVTFTDERAAEVGSERSASEIGALRFANEAYDAEMCILSGNAVGAVIPEFPDIGSTRVPDFARAK